jgi:hypothetical protein
MTVKLTYGDNFSSVLRRYVNIPYDEEDYCFPVHLRDYTVSRYNQKLRVYDNKEKKLIYEVDSDMIGQQPVLHVFVGNKFIYERYDDQFMMAVVDAKEIKTYDIIGLDGLRMHYKSFGTFIITNKYTCESYEDEVNYLAVFTEVTIGDKLMYAFTDIVHVDRIPLQDDYLSTRSIPTSDYELVARKKADNLFLYKSKGYKELTLDSMDQLLAISKFSPDLPIVDVTVDDGIFSTQQVPTPSRIYWTGKHRIRRLDVSNFMGYETVLIHLKPKQRKRSENYTLVDRIHPSMIADKKYVMQVSTATLWFVNAVINAWHVTALNDSYCIGGFDCYIFYVDTFQTHRSPDVRHYTTHDRSYFGSECGKIYVMSMVDPSMVLEVTMP